MTKIIPLGAETRERAGKGTARQTRRDGRIPAVIYGGKQAPVTISLEKFEFNAVPADAFAMPPAVKALIK